MNIKSNILENIGRTPLVKINKINNGEALIFAKLESANPGGSIKDRAALSMIEDAERNGKVNSDTVIIEPTSGNTGIGLAMVCAVKGYKLILTMPDTMSVERISLLKAYGAEIILTPGIDGMIGSIKKAEELVVEYGNAFMPQQFKNEANPRIHRMTTAMEILNDTDWKVDIVVAGVGSGGTITGVGEMLKEHRKEIKIIAIEPKDSAVLSGKNPGGHRLQGIGAGFIPEVLNTKIYDEVIEVSNEDAYETTREIAKKEGILVGISSGAAMWAAVELSKRHENKGKNIVVILTDTGERYLSAGVFV